MSTPMLDFVMQDYHHFNAGALKRAFIDYYKLVVKKGGKMYLALAGAMSSAQLGIVLAPAIRRGLIHGISSTGANVEESIFRLVADKHYNVFPDYRYHSLQNETTILKKELRRVTDLTIPEEEAFRKMERWFIPRWRTASLKGERYHWHEFFYQYLRQKGVKKEFEGDPKECWLLEAAKADLPIVVPGYADSTLGNVFTANCQKGKCNPQIAKSDVEQFMNLYEVYRKLSRGPGVGFFQIGGGIAGDFPICVVPSLIYDLEERKKTKPWAYFCQISDSVTSYGGYSGATPNEKITWDKLREDTPKHVVESDATIVVPIQLEALFEAQDNRARADRLIAEYEADQRRRKVKL